MNSIDSDLFESVDGLSTSRARRALPETGSFGKSTRRSRSRTHTPGVRKQEDPTLAAADKIFSEFIANQAAISAENPQRKPKLTSSVTQPNLSGSTPLSSTDGNGDTSKPYVHKEPTEVILRGFKSTHQYAAIREYERIAGRICEDYPRDPPIEQRKYKSDLRDPAVLRKMAMSPEERAKALRYAGGEHWIKITFESAEAAEIAVENSPQTILGHLVSAELYRGVPPTSDAEVPANATTEQRTPRADRFTRSAAGTLTRSHTTPTVSRAAESQSPPGSNSSSHTLDSATLSTATASSATITTPYAPRNQNQNIDADENSPVYCRRIPTAKKIKLLPAEQALLPQQSYSQRLLAKIPLVSWLSSDIIGNQIPKTESGEFDWAKASLYWKFIWWVDGITGWFDVAGGDKEE
jgi:hypothetical protein